MSCPFVKKQQKIEGENKPIYIKGLLGETPGTVYLRGKTSLTEFSIII